ncbi:MAG: dipicolinate synthase subunit B [Clostridiales bacterium]|nr:dipicolinate synthase subunit B [Clostridiales bacterium]
MTELKGARIGCVMTGSFCTFEAVFGSFEALVQAGAELFPIMSENAYSLDTRFGTAAEMREAFERIAGRTIWHTLQEVEPIGPRKLLDIVVVAPCTGNTLAKLARGITDTPATMAAKSHLRNGRPVLLAISTNDGLGRSAKSIGALLAMKHIFFVPFRQDDWRGKPNSLVSEMELVPEAAVEALNNRQIQPLLLPSRPTSTAQGKEIRQN